MSFRAVSLVVVIAATASSSCGGGGGGGSGSGPAGKRIGPALAAALDASAAMRPPALVCGSADLPPAPDQTLGKWTVAAHTLTAPATARTIGVIADAGGAAPPTIAALGRLRARLAPADVVIALGGMGADQAQIEATIAAIATPDHPIVVVPGDLEPIDALQKAVAALAARKVAAIDGRLVQRIAIPDTATIALVGGALAPERLVSAGGCVVHDTDRTTTAAELAALPSPSLRILATWEAPRAGGLDAPSGDLPPAATTGVDLVLAGARDVQTPATSGARDGAAITLAPGSADATRNNHPPTAGLLILGADHTWTWKPIADSAL